MARSTRHRFDPTAAFEAGRYKEVVATVNSPGRTDAEVDALVGSLAFLGRIDEALQVRALRRPTMSPRTAARSRFHVALAQIRASKFKSARRLLEENRLDPKTRARAEVRQGLGFFHYYVGRFDEASRHALAALKLAVRDDDRYMRTLATDLVGHALAQKGELAKGLRYLRIAREMADSEDFSYDAQILIYEAEAGSRRSTIVAELEAALAKGRDEDTYSKSGLTLALARELTLRGHFKRAREILDREALSIYSYENRRHEASLQLGLAEIAYRQGDATSARHFLRAAERCLSRIADRRYEQRILRRRLAIDAKLGSTETSDETSKRLAELDVSFPRSSQVERVEESALDPDDVFAKGYYGLWPEAAALENGRSHLVVFLRGDWIAVGRDEVVRSERTLSAQSRRLVARLAHGITTKAELTRDVWGYDYDPIRHDPMVHSGLAALRRSLGVHGAWVRSHDEGWSLDDGAHAVLFRDEKEMKVHVEPKARRIEAITSADTATHLNWRQIKALDDLERRQGWTVPDYREVFAVSTMTAWRDLATLETMKYVTRTGRGRATRYVR